MSDDRFVQSLSHSVRRSTALAARRRSPPLATTLSPWSRTIWEGDSAAGACGSEPRGARGYHALDPMLLRKCRWPSDPAPPWCGMVARDHAATPIVQYSRGSCAPLGDPRRSGASQSRSASGGAGPNPDRSPSTRGRHPVHCRRQPRVQQVSAPDREWAPSSHLLRA